MGSSMSKASKNYNAQMRPIDDERARKKAGKAGRYPQNQPYHYGQSQQAKKKPYAYPSKGPKAQPYSSFGRSSPSLPMTGRQKRAATTPQVNCWIAASGMAQNVPMEMLRTFKSRDCDICRRRIDPNSDYFVMHNCSKLYHDKCMRKYLPQFYDRHGRMSRPMCPYCRGDMNIRDCGKSRKNPLGFEQFNGW